MSEQPTTGARREAPNNLKQEATDPPAPSSHGHVRTDGEITVDDALGTADDPR